MGKEYHCRICGLFQGGGLRDPSETSGNLYDNPDGTSPYFLYDICACCGAFLGVEDDGPTDEIALVYIRKYRQEWLDGGAKWFSPRRKPADWDLDAQLKQIPEGWE